MVVLLEVYKAVCKNILQVYIQYTAGYNLRTTGSCKVPCIFWFTSNQFTQSVPVEYKPVNGSVYWIILVLF